MVRKLMTILLAALVLLGCLCTASAEGFDPQRTGSLTVTLTEQYEKTPIVGAQLSLYQVATVGINNAGQLTYAYTEAFSATGISLEDPDLAKKLDAHLSEHAVDAKVMTTDATGTATCGDLPLGLYFVRQTGAVAGFAPCTSFLVTIPQQQDGAFTYAVNASPKTEVAKLTSITIRKVWNTDASTPAAQEVTVQLLRDGAVLQTVTLNSANNWQVTLEAMPESDGYSIREVGVPKGFTATYQQKGYVFTVTNTSTLAQTGQVIWPIPVLAGCGLMFLWLGLALLRKKRDAND